MTDREFIELWNGCDYVDQVAMATGKLNRVVSKKAASLRTKGFRLKRLSPRRSLVTFSPHEFTQETFDSLLGGFSRPDFGGMASDTETQLTEEVYRRAAALRRARPARATVEDRRKPVETAVIRTVDIGLPS